MNTIEEQEAGFLIIDKPSDWTSHDVVAKMRGVLGIRKIGHLGTLDPLATGVLVLAVGRGATKKVQEYMKLDKEYELEMELWKTSDTYDSEGQVVETPNDRPPVTQEMIEAEVKNFWGKTMQRPPAFSAKKIGGKKAYELARAGKEVKLAEREVEMQGSNLVYEAPFIRMTLWVTSGTYVRSFIHDLGQVLGCGAIMTALRRTRVGDFKLEDAKTIQEVIELRESGEDIGLIPV